MLVKSDIFSVKCFFGNGNYAIGVAKTTISRLVYLLARETFLIEDLRTILQLPNTLASEKLLPTLNAKREKIPQDFYGTGAMIDRSWTAANFEMRHVLTRLSSCHLQK